MIKQQLVIIQTTVASDMDARKIATSLLSKKLAGSVHIHGPVETHYMLKGKEKSDDELVVRATTQAERIIDCINDVKANHKYAVPAILVLPVGGANKPYADWVAEQTTK